MREKKLIEYQTPDGRLPFSEWLNSKRVEVQSRARIDVRLDRLMLGLVGDSRSVGDGVFELRFHFGPGLRVYFAYYGEEIILLLGGGDKHSQQKDILLAKDRWRDFKRRNEQ